MYSIGLRISLMVVAIANHSLAQNIFYETQTGLIHLQSNYCAPFTTVELLSESGQFLGDKSEFPHFDGLFDEYHEHKAFKLDAAGFDEIHSFARLPSGLLYDDLVDDLSIFGSFVGAVCGFRLVASKPCTDCVNFDSPVPNGAVIIGTESTGIQVAGGHPLGYLQLTDASPQQAGAIIFPQEMSPANHRVIIGASTDDQYSHHLFDNLGFNPGLGAESLSDSTDFSITADVSMPGSVEPGSGSSINVVRPHDPILVNAEAGILAGFASTGDGQLNRLEEGATTGLAIGFDESSNGEGDVVGISLRVDNQLVTQIPLETVNGAFDDPTSLQTGTSWAALGITVSDAESNDYYGSHVTIDWKEHTVFDGPVAIVGDSNFNKRFDSSDLVQVFTAGLYETGIAATWESGDWNLDGGFDSSDLVTAFSADTFSNQAVQVPESSALLTIPAALVLVVVHGARRPRQLAASFCFDDE